jgi:hypothetical protein
VDDTWCWVPVPIGHGLKDISLSPSNTVMSVVAAQSGLTEGVSSLPDPSSIGSASPDPSVTGPALLEPPSMGVSLAQPHG